MRFPMIIVDAASPSIRSSPSACPPLSPTETESENRRAFWILPIPHTWPAREFTVNYIVLIVFLQLLLAPKFFMGFFRRWV